MCPSFILVPPYLGDEEAVVNKMLTGTALLQDALGRRKLTVVFVGINRTSFRSIQ